MKGYPRMRCRKENDRTTWSFDTWPLHLSEMSVPNEMDSGKSLKSPWEQHKITRGNTKGNDDRYQQSQK